MRIFLLVLSFIFLSCQHTNSDLQSSRQINSVNTPNPRDIRGYIDGDEILKTGIVKGWTCLAGHNQSIQFKVFIGGPQGQGTEIGTYTAAQSNEPAVNEACQTKNSSHRFTMLIPNQILKSMPGLPIYVYGINPKTSELGWLNFNGKFVTPDPNSRSVQPINFSKHQLIGDLGFTNGFKVMDIDASEMYVNRLPGEHLSAPTWEIAQWGTIEPIPNKPAIDKNYYTWSNRYKALKVGTTPTTNTEVIFSIDSDAEYSGIYRRSSDERTWPHLLISQTIATPENITNYKPLYFAKQMMLDLDIQILFANNIKKTGYDSGTHTSQFVLYFTLQNLNPNTKSYKKFIWFGVPLYDARYPFVPAAAFIDKATQSLIWAPDGREILSTSLHDMKSHTIQKDLLPFMKKAIDYAYRKGIMDTNNLNDYYIGHMNTGFEVPGLAVVQVKIKNLSLVQYN